MALQLGGKMEDTEDGRDQGEPERGGELANFEFFTRNSRSMSPMY